MDMDDDAVGGRSGVNPGTSALAMVVLLLAACSSGAGEPHSPRATALQVTGIAHDVCTPAAWETGNVGLDTFHVTGPGPVTIQGAEWRDVRGLQVRSIRVYEHVPNDRFDTFGVLSGFPPVESGGGVMDRSLRAAWARSVPPEGAVFPESAGPGYFLNVIVSYSGARGRGGPLRLYYTDARGRNGVAESEVTVRVRASCDRG